MTAQRESGVTRQEGTRPPSPRDRVSPAILETIVKSLLEMVVLSYLLEEARTGRELIDDIRKDTGVCLSPGRVYPLLRSLENRGLLSPVRGARQVLYNPANRAKAEEQVCRSLDECTGTVKFFRDICKCGKRP